MMGNSEDYTAIPPDLEHDRDIAREGKRLKMAIDGQKTIRMTAVTTCKVPASMKMEQDTEGMTVLDGFFPSLIIMSDLGDGVGAGGGPRGDVLHRWLRNGPFN